MALPSGPLETHEAGIPNYHSCHNSLQHLAEWKATARVHRELVFAVLQALSDTLVVIAIVAGTAVSLFAVNTVLSDISKQIY